MGIINEEYFSCHNVINNIIDANNTNNTNITNITLFLDTDDNIDDLIKCEALIGYSYNDAVPISFLIIALIGFVLNILLIKDFIVKTNASSRKQSSMKKLFAVLPVLDAITSLYWIISAIAFRNDQKINDRKETFTLLSVIYYSVFTFEFIFINFILIHFRKLV